MPPVLPLKVAAGNALVLCADLPLKLSWDPLVDRPPLDPRLRRLFVDEPDALVVISAVVGTRPDRPEAPVTPLMVDAVSLIG